MLGTQILATLIAVFGIITDAPGTWLRRPRLGLRPCLVPLLTHRVKIWAYRLDPSGKAEDKDQRSGRVHADLSLMAASVAPFHTDVRTGSETPVYHDSASCQYAKEITHDHHVVAGTDNRQRCSWCERHAHVAPFHTDVRTGPRSPSITMRRRVPTDKKSPTTTTTSWAPAVVDGVRGARPTRALHSLVSVQNVESRTPRHPGPLLEFPLW